MNYVAAARQKPRGQRLIPLPKIWISITQNMDANSFAGHASIIRGSA
jgi:hypothetical protein